MSQPFATVRVDDLKDMLTKRATIERLDGDIAKSSHTLMIRNMILRAVKKGQNKTSASVKTAQNAIGKVS